MGLRFNRRVTLIPGLRVNLSKSGASLSIGHRGLWWTIGPRPRERRVTVGLPGSGLFWTERYAAHHNPANIRGGAPPKVVPLASPPHAGNRAAFVIVLALALLALVAFLGHP